MWRFLTLLWKLCGYLGYVLWITKVIKFISCRVDRSPVISKEILFGEEKKKPHSMSVLVRICTPDLWIYSEPCMNWFWRIIVVVLMILTSSLQKIQVRVNSVHSCISDAYNVKFYMLSNQCVSFLRAEALQSVVLLMGEKDFFEYYAEDYKVHNLDWTQSAAKEILQTWQRKFTEVLFWFFLILVFLSKAYSLWICPVVRKN